MDIYRKIVLTQMPRILGFGDRNQNSKTFGCFDRYYWHYRLADLPSVIFQDAALLLALVYKHDFQGNIYYKNANVLGWTRGVIDFWAKIQNRDGSFNEIYPFEQNFCATAFSTYSVTSAMLILGKSYHIPKLEKTARWLIKNDNLEVSNQMAACAVALYNLYLITKKEIYRIGSNDKISKLLKMQDKSGFFVEYGGCDIGYLSLTISLLADYCKKTDDKNVYYAMKRALKFMEKKIRADGSYNYKETSRGTQFLYTYGIKQLKSDVIKKHIKGLESNIIINPTWMDDRYCIPLTTDYLRSYLVNHDVNDNR